MWAYCNNNPIIYEDTVGTFLNAILGGIIGGIVGGITAAVNGDDVLSGACIGAATGALGAIGFSNDVSWVDSACFLLAFLLKCQEDGVFQLKRARWERPKEILESMSTTTYKSIAKSLGLQYSFNEG